MAYLAPPVRARGYHLRGDYLHDFRTCRGMTQQQMADWLGVKSNTVARWERGERSLPPLLGLVLALWEEIESRP